MKPFSSSCTFLALEVRLIKGLFDRRAPLVSSLHLGHIFGASPRHCCDDKHSKHGNCQNNWTFSLAVEWLGGGGGLSEASLVFGGDEEQVERGGRGFRVGGGLVV